jgi:hypothetical protein
MKSALVVISHYNAWPIDQLVSLLDQMREIPSGYPFRCLIVVNQAFNRPLDLPERHSNVEIFYRENTGYNIGAWEYGWRIAPPADYYLFLQEECRIVRTDWLGSSIRMLSNPSIGLVGESMAWPGQKWDRVAYLHTGHPFLGDPSVPPIDHIGGVKRFLNAKGIPLGERGEHLQSLILGTRREVLEAIDGFMIGQNKGDAIACEIAISLAVVAKGMKVKQVGLLPFRYIMHPQWAHLNQGAFKLLMEGVDRYTPTPMLSFLRTSIFRLWKLLTIYSDSREPSARGLNKHSVSSQATRSN